MLIDAMQYAAPAKTLRGRPRMNFCRLSWSFVRPSISRAFETSEALIEASTKASWMPVPLLPRNPASRVITPLAVWSADGINYPVQALEILPYVLQERI